MRAVAADQGIATFVARKQLMIACSRNQRVVARPAINAVRSVATMNGIVTGAGHHYIIAGVLQGHMVVSTASYDQHVIVAMNRQIGVTRHVLDNDLQRRVRGDRVGGRGKVQDLSIGIERLTSIADLNLDCWVIVMVVMMVMMASVMAMIIVIVVIMMLVIVVVIVKAAVIQQIIDNCRSSGWVDIWREKMIQLGPVQIISRHLLPLHCDSIFFELLQETTTALQRFS
jgi:hypothetical protein